MNIVHNASVNWYQHQFAGLEPVSETGAIGSWQAVFVGPLWLRVGARCGVPFSGLRGWVGKRIEGGGRAVNLVTRGGMLQDYCPMQVSSGPSRVDKGTSLIFRYPPESPGLLRFFQDELRQWKDGDILAFATIDLPLLRHLPLPFVLQPMTGDQQ